MENKSKKCPRCGARLDENTIGFFSEGTNYYKTYLDGEFLGYELDEPFEIGERGFYCRECGTDLPLSEEEVIEILKEVASETQSKRS